MQSISAYVILVIKGILMGAANVIPGVSGGTVAFIAGIYERLIGSLHAMDLVAIKLLFTGKWKALAQRIDLKFLMAVFGGIILATLSLAKLIQYLLEEHDIIIWAFFFGLICASSIIIIRKIKSWTIIVALFLAAGIAISYFVSSLSLIKTPDTHFYLFISGAIAFMTMILPGISGSFILVIMDKYTYVINMVASITDGIKGVLAGTLSMADSITTMQLFPLVIFMIGGSLGLISFSKILNWLFTKYHDIAIAFLTGFMIGSLYKVWPWKVTIDTYVNSQGETKPLIEQNILPAAMDTAFFTAAGLALGGFLIVYILERISIKN